MRLPLPFWPRRSDLAPIRSVCAVDHEGVCEWGVDPVGRRPGRAERTSRPGSRSPRSLGSAPGSSERVDAFRNRTLGQDVSRAVAVATGITADGTREVLGVDIGDSEDETFWTRFCRGLSARGLSGVPLFICDAHAALRAAITRCLSGS